MKQKLVLKDSEINRAMGKADTLHSYNQTLEAEIKDLRSKVAELNGAVHSGQTETIKQEHQKNQHELEIYDLKQQVNVLREENKKAVADLAVSQKEANDQSQKCAALQQQIERLKSLVENLDQNKEELIKRLQAGSQDKKDEISDKAILQNDVSNYKRDLLAKDQEIMELKQSIASLDASLDELQSELDAKTEELAAYRQKLDKQVLEYGNMQH